MSQNLTRIAIGVISDTHGLLDHVAKSLLASADQPETDGFVIGMARARLRDGSQLSREVIACMMRVGK